MTWEQLTAMLAGRTRRRLGPAALVASWHGREIVVSRATLGDVELVTLEIFLCRRDEAPSDLDQRGGRLSFGACVLVGERWLLRATAPLGGIEATAWETLARTLAAAARTLSHTRRSHAAVIALFSYLS